MHVCNFSVSVIEGITVVLHIKVLKVKPQSLILHCLLEFQFVEIIGSFPWLSGDT